MKVFVRGKGEISLGKNDFVAKGGEGEIYIKNGLVFKVYHEARKMISEAKIQELDTITYPYIIKPLDVLLDKKNTKIGFTMKQVKNSDALCKLFTNDYWKRNGITTDIITKLVTNMVEGIANVHSAKCLIVDGNEFNYLVDTKKFETPHFIDVDSYQTPSFKATAIMPSIRDYSTKDFTTLTDWYSFAIISFQLFVGIHPFKGKCDGYKKGDLQARMVDNLSVFNGKVRTPPTMRDIKKHVPQNFIFWYQDIFENGKRLEPPTIAGKIDQIVGQVKYQIIKGSDNFEIKLIQEYKSDILFYGKIEGKEVVKLSDAYVYINNKGFGLDENGAGDAEVLFTMKKQVPVFINVEDEKLLCEDGEGYEVGTSMGWNCEVFMIVGNHAYLKMRGNLTEIVFGHMAQGKIMQQVKSNWNIMPNASKLFSGVMYQDVLGKACLLIPEPSDSGNSKCHTIFVKELDEYKVLDAKHDNRVVVLMVHKGNMYFKVILRFDESYIKYDVRIIEDVDYAGINFITLDNGIVIMINSDGSLEVFSNRVGSNGVKKIEDDAIDPNMKLYKDGTKVLFTLDNGLFRLKMKGN